MMSVKENVRHAFGLIFTAIGGVGVLLGFAWFVGGIVDLAEREDGRGSWIIGCSGFTLAVSAFLLRRGIAMRKHTIEAGSTMQREGAGFGTDSVHTSHTETKKSSFLEKPDEGEWER